MTLNLSSCLKNNQKKWLDQLTITKDVKDLGIYIRSLKHLNHFASSRPRESLDQYFIDEFLLVYLLDLVNKNELMPSTAKAYYNICFRFLTWMNNSDELKKYNIQDIFSNIKLNKENKELNFEALLSEKQTIIKCSVEFKLIITTILIEKQLRIEDIISLSINELDKINNIPLKTIIKNYIYSNRRFSRLEKSKSDVPHDKIFYSQRGALYSLDSFRSRLSELNKGLSINNVHISSKNLRQFSITNKQACILINGIINE